MDMELFNMTTDNVNWNHTKAALQSLEVSVKCKICDKLPEDPHLLWCKHTFCKECISKLPHCPECNHPVKTQELVRNIMLERLLNLMKFSSETISRSPVIEDAPEKEVAKKSSVTTELKTNEPLKCKTNKTIDKKKSLIQNDSTNDLKKEILKKNPSFALTNGSNKLNEVNKNNKSKYLSLKNLVKSSTRHNDDDQRKAQQEITPKYTSPKRSSRKNSLSSEKDNIHESVQATKKSEHDLIPNKRDENKTPKRKLNLSSKNLCPKSHILFSAKKLQSSHKVNEKGETALQIACRRGKLDLVKKLLEGGAEPNVKDYTNWTPLCDAVWSGEVEVVKALLEAGAAVNTPSKLNTTALMEAVLRKNVAMVQLLMNYGANMHQRTALNFTPLSVADDEIKRVLMNFENSSIQPFSRVRCPARAILAVKLSPEHIDQLMTLCRRFNLTLSTAFTEEISHVVVKRTEDNVCHASVPVMLGILRGCSVVGTDWVSACLEKSELLPADGFEPGGTEDYPNTDVFRRARLNQEQLLPRLFDGCHISLQQDQSWPENHKHDVISLIRAGGAEYQPRQCDPERISDLEQTVMFHASKTSPLAEVSHIILYQPGPLEPLLKYNMAHAKSLSVSWFVQCIKTFTLS